MGRPKRTTLSQRQLEALQLRAAGATYQQIGDVLKTNKGNAYRLVRDALPKREPSDEELRLDLFRLDQALMGLTPAIKQGDPEAISLLIRVIETSAMLLRSRSINIFSRPAVSMCSWSRETSSPTSRACEEPEGNSPHQSPSS